MKKLLIFTSLFLASVSSVSAQTATPAPGAPVVNGTFLQKVNPLTVVGNSMSGVPPEIQELINLSRFNTPGNFVNALLPFLFSLAGVILFIMITWGGFEMMMGAADTKSQEAGKQRITAALIGFVLLFMTYWIAQIVQYIFGVNILG